MEKKDLVLLTDFYEFTMAYAYFKENKHQEIAYFDMFIRSLPQDTGYLVFNGLHKFIEYVKNFEFKDEHIEYLRSTNKFDEDFLEYLSNLKLNIDVWSVKEGTIVFNNEPLLTIRGNLVEAQIIETILLLCINYSTLVTTKASRIVYASKNRAVLEFGTRRAQDFEAALTGARGAVIAGCAGTACTVAGMEFDLDVSGTIAHSYVQLHDSEYEAFLSYAKVAPDNCVLLVDTYDTLNSGIPNAIKVAKEYLIPNNHKLAAIRLDSGDLAYLSKKARKMLDEAGLYDTKIVASNSLDEYLIDDLLNQGAKIDIFGVGENLITSKSSPVISGVYKVVAIEKDNDIIPKIKISENIQKITNPGIKNLYRFYDKDSNKAIADLLTLEHETINEESYELFDPNSPWKRKVITNYYVKNLREKIFDHGKLVYQVPSTAEVIKYHQQELATIWDELKRLRFPHKYYVDLSQELFELKNNLIKSLRKK